MSSIALATRGKFNSCCGRIAGGGGAPPYRQNYDERVLPKVVVTKVRFESIASESKINFNIKLLDSSEE